MGWITDGSSLAHSIRGRSVGAGDVDAGQSGFLHAYRYKDPSSGLFDVTFDRAEAEALSGGECEAVIVHCECGFVDCVIGPAGGEGRADPGGCGSADGRPQNASEGVAPSDHCPCGSGRRFADCHGISHPDQPRYGLGHAYGFRDPVTGEYRISADMTFAHLIVGDGFEVVWVVFEDGEVKRAATADEYLEEIEVRTGEQIFAGVSDRKLGEFDAIEDPREATRWLEANRPDYHDIVARVMREMERAKVLDPAVFD